MKGEKKSISIFIPRVTLNYLDSKIVVWGLGGGDRERERKRLLVQDLLGIDKESFLEKQKKKGRKKTDKYQMYKTF